MRPSLVATLALLAFASAIGSPPPDYHNGVSLGGWLLTEPSWMYDRFSAPAEADLVAQLRETSDAFAVRTMQNHWRGYLPDAAFDALAQERSSASPVALVPRALSFDEAAALAAADVRLSFRRAYRDQAVDMVSWWMWHRSLGDDGLMSREADEEIAGWSAERDARAAEADAALAARAPLLAAQWEAAS